MRFSIPNTARRSAAAFTMVEIALCLAIVGFALVAIIGVLPAGLNVQKENREDTILNQEATAWIDAIRAGGAGPALSGTFDDLTNYVDRIVVETYFFASTNAQPALVAPPIVAQPVNAGPTTLLITNGAQIVGLLSIPKIIIASTNSFYSNYVYAYCRAMNGGAADKPPQDNPDVRDLAFGYRMVVDITPYGSGGPGGISTNILDQIMSDNLSDVRLLLRWPLKSPFNATQPANPAVGGARMTFRTRLSGAILPAGTTGGILPYFYLQPRQYRP
jgi:type II secretory pathway pseudopilin PulG